MIRIILRAVALSATLAATGLTLAAPAQASAASGSLLADPRPSATQQDNAAAGKTLAAVCPAGAPSYDIGPGSTGRNVREVQCLLNHTLSWNAYPHPIPETGIYDGATAAAVRVFQVCANNRGAGLVVDARVGRNTLPHLRWWGQHTYETGEVMC